MDAGFKWSQIYADFHICNLYKFIQLWEVQLSFHFLVQDLFAPKTSVRYTNLLDISEIPSKSDCTLNINLTTLFLRANKVLLQANLRRITSFTKKTLSFKKMLSRRFLRMEPCDSSTFAQLKALINYDFNSKANNLTAPPGPPHKIQIF